MFAAHNVAFMLDARCARAPRVAVHKTAHSDPRGVFFFDFVSFRLCICIVCVGRGVKQA